MAGYRPAGAGCLALKSHYQLLYFSALQATRPGAKSISQFHADGCGYKPAKAGCLALKSVFVIFFQKTEFWHPVSENNQRQLSCSAKLPIILFNGLIL